jgi:type II secretory pathway pseudopilin PulG
MTLPVRSGPALRSRASSARARAGFTLVEVMAAGAVFLIGILGVSYMQSASVRSNQDAYESMVATNFAKLWLERIKRDALSWTAPGVPASAAMFPARPAAPGAQSYFAPGLPGAMPANGSGLWPLDARESTGANYHGFEIGQTDPMTGLVVGNADIYYCAFGSFTGASNDRNGQLSTMTATVTVWWNRKASLELTDYTGIYAARAAANGCDGAAPAANVFTDVGLPASLRRVRLAQAFRWTQP